MPPLPPDLEAAFRNTTYTADIPSRELKLRIDTPSPPLAQLLHQHHTRTAAYLTAVNPHAQSLTDEANHQRLQELDTLLRHHNLTAYPGRALADSNDWPPEPSRLILAIDLQQATAIANRFDQRAFLCIDLNRSDPPAPQLITL
ncbi:DUF3293 domain-containing protein [Mucisphaera sp.]|uniref:DUF3293 domain-containing protein n=1 Tax=Mucisphaera sp. TaxID=2913024 RepID=UPI003D0C224B